jgi:anti-anti-sigma factor
MKGADHGPALHVDRTTIGGAPAVTVYGEIDAGTAVTLDDALEAAVRETRGVLVVDLSGVSFLDSAGVMVLLRGRSLLGREDREMAMICPRRTIRDVLETIAVNQLFVVFATREDAARTIVQARR